MLFAWVVCPRILVLPGQGLSRPNVSSETMMIAPGSAFGYIFSVEFIRAVEKTPQPGGEYGAKARSARFGDTLYFPDIPKYLM